MSFLDQVQKPIPQAPVITIVGFAGGGKSSLAGRFNKPIFIQAENATSVFEDWPTDTQPSFFLNCHHQTQNATSKQVTCC